MHFACETEFFDRKRRARYIGHSRSLNAFKVGICREDFFYLVVRRLEIIGRFDFIAVLFHAGEFFQLQRFCGVDPLIVRFACERADFKNIIAFSVGQFTEFFHKMTTVCVVVERFDIVIDIRHARCFVGNDDDTLVARFFQDGFKSLR